jgi:hypothetical protein
LDDIIVSSRTVQEHRLHLDEVLSKLPGQSCPYLHQLTEKVRQFQMAGKLPAGTIMGIQAVES